MKKRCNLLLPAKLKKNADTFAKKEGWTFTRLVEESLSHYLATNNCALKLIEEHRKANT